MLGKLSSVSAGQVPGLELFLLFCPCLQLSHCTIASVHAWNDSERNDESWNNGESEDLVPDLKALGHGVEGEQRSC